MLDPKRAGEDVEDAGCACRALLDGPTSDLNKNERLGYKLYRFKKIAQYASIIYSRPVLDAKKLVYFTINKPDLVGNKYRRIAHICAKSWGSSSSSIMGD